jgi:uroporphyrinogen-III synthase
MPLISALVQAGARPIWCPTIRVEPLDDLSDLDDALMRLIDYDALIVLSTDSVDSISERWLSIGQGDTTMVNIMLEASNVQIGVVGIDAAHFRKRVGQVANIISPVDQEVRALVKALVDLGYVKPGGRLLVASGLVQGSASEHLQPRSVATVLQELQEFSSTADVIGTHKIVTNDLADITTELSLLRSGKIDAICAGSSEELSTLLQLAATSSPQQLPLIVALGEETAAVAQELAPSADDLLVMRAKVSSALIVRALEEHFGAGKLL